MYDHTEPIQMSNAAMWELAQDLARNPRPIDRSELGITTPKTYDGLEIICDGDFSIKLPGFLGKIAKFLFE